MKTTTLRMISILSAVSAASLSACAAGDDSQDTERTGEAAEAITPAWKFTWHGDYSPTTTPNGVDVGDVDGDGFADVVVVSDENNGTSSSVSVRLNDGLGNLGAPTILTGAFRKSTHVKLGKLQQSTTAGHLDIAVHGGDSNGGRVTLFLNDGAGTFGAAQQFPAGYGNQGMSLGDFDNDGKLDVATTGQGNAVVLLGDGLGGLGAKLQIATDTSESGIDTGDLDADGNLDIVTSHASLGQVDVLLGDGLGGFAAKVGYSTGLHTCTDATTVATSPAGVLLADYDNDGCKDILTYNQGACSSWTEFSVSVLEGQKVNGTCTGTFGAAVLTLLEPGVSPGDAAVADFDGDGKIDIALPQNDVQPYLAQPKKSSHLLLWAGNGDGTFHQGSGARTFGDGYPLGAVAAGNVAVGGGSKDLVVTSRTAGHVMVLFNAAACGNGIQDGNETGVDCGGQCQCQYLSSSQFVPLAYQNNVHECLGMDSVYWNGAIVVDGVTYPHGLGMHPPSASETADTTCASHQSVTNATGHAQAAWTLDGDYGTFKARLGIAAPECWSMDGVVYRVYADSTLKYTSPTVGNSTSPIDILVDVSGAQTVVLDVSSGAASDSHCDHAVWVDARVQ